MLVFPNCKINLGLRIVGKREDGYHNLETIFYPIQIQDALEFVSNHQGDENEFSITGLAVQGKPEENLIIKAWLLLKKDFPKLPPLKIHLHKVIPMGAGLGGGSADAAFMLRALNDHFKLDMRDERLMRFALELGSDCPFFILNKPAFATGRGEVLEAIDLDLSQYRILVVNPGIHINTGWVFSQLANHPGLSAGSQPLHEIICQPISSWKDNLQNDLEAPVFQAHPQVRSIRDELYSQGALYASMSGSGSTVFGIFENEPDAGVFKKQNYFVRLVN